MSNLFFKSESVKTSVKSGLNFVSKRVFKAFLLMSTMRLSWNGWGQGYTVIYPEGQTMANPGDVVTVVFDEDATNYYYGFDYKDYCFEVDEVDTLYVEIKFLLWQISNYKTYAKGEADPPKDCVPDYLLASQVDGFSNGIDDFSIQVTIPSDYKASSYVFYYGVKTDDKVIANGQKQGGDWFFKYPETEDTGKVKKWTKSFTA
ncbi:MAG: hypothetical protein J6P99_02730 [Paludibacteraceae bacterium]|nr:hypothetical protein [Paludibacteraceae bacterium]